MARYQVGAKKGAKDLKPAGVAQALDKHPKDKIKASKPDAEVPKVEAKREHDKGKKRD